MTPGHGDQRRGRFRVPEAGLVSGFRLPSGGAIDRGRPLAFTFDGKAYLGAAGDSLASALLANGVRIVGRSFKYHRPRGVWGAWTEEPNAIVDVTRRGCTTPNLRATVEALENDLAVRSVNAAPTAAEDRSALIDRLSRFMPSGFYYKTFLWPRWETFEPAVRAMAGLGIVDPDNRPAADSPQFNAHCDVLVVGAGPAGLAAAGAAAEAGRVVFLVDDHAEIGGQLAHRGGLDRRRRLAGMGRKRARRSRGERRARPDVDRRLRRLRSQSRLRLGAARPFAGRALAHPREADRGRRRRDRAAARRSRQRPSRRDVGRRGARLSPPLRRAGRPADHGRDQQRQRLSRRRGARRGRRRGRDRRFARRGADDGAARFCAARRSRASQAARASPASRSAARRRDADTLLLSGGWTPTVHLYMQARGKLRYDESRAALVPSVGGRGRRRRRRAPTAPSRSTRRSPKATGLAAAKAPLRTRRRAGTRSRPSGRSPTRRGAAGSTSRAT